MLSFSTKIDNRTIFNKLSYLCTKAGEDIEWDILSRYQMQKPYKDGREYILTIPYETDEELDRIIYEDILREARRIADLRNGFIEADVISLDDPDRSW